MAQKKILFVTHLFHPAPGGVETHLHRLSQGLVKKDYQVRVLTTNAYSTEAFFLNDKRRMALGKEFIDDVEVERLGFQTFGRRTLNILRSLACRIKYPLNSWIRTFSYGPRNPRFVEKILEYSPDFLFAAPLPTFNVIYAHRAFQKLKVPFIVIPSYHIHDPCSFHNPIFFQIMRDANLIMAQSEMEKEFLQKEADIHPKKIVIFPPLPLTEKDLTPAKPSDSKQNLRKKYGIHEKKVILYLGQHGRHKNIEPVINAMPFIWHAVQDTALVIAGGTTKHTQHIKSMAKKLEPTYGQKIHFIDNFPQKDKNDIFNMADIFMCLSEFESFGIVFAEALVHGLPVIASCFGVASSIIENFKTGLLVNPRCDVEVSGAALELLLDEEIRKQYGDHARQTAFTKYHPQAILDKWEQHLSSLS
ncbi:MAG: glycosyltransferase [Candidatus Aminicenantes bacterium]|nr:glycosyltransferase [Candidatus Aminicenantes bacterium]